MRELRAPCGVCEGYGLVPAPANTLTTCTACTGRGTVLAAIPCPVHQRLVACTPDRHLVGRCDQCAGEAAAGIAAIKAAA